MSITSITNGGVANPITPITSASAKRASSMPPAPAASATISTAGDLFSKLMGLEQKDPTKFKQVAAQLSSDLKTAAGKATGGDALALNKLADGFSQAASTGSLAALQSAQGAPQAAPQQGGATAGHPHHHGGHHHGGQQPSGDVQSVLSKALDEVNSALGTGTPPSA